MDSLEHSVQNHSEFNHVCQELKLMLKEQRDKIRENDNIAVEKDVIVKQINILKVNICIYKYGIMTNSFEAFVNNCHVIYIVGNENGKFKRKRYAKPFRSCV